jgi:hypothetical protein
MNTVYGPCSGHRMAEAAGSVIGAAVWALAHLLRLVLLAILGTLEPIVRVVLSFLSLTTLLTAAIAYVGGPPGLKVSYGILLTFAIGCAVALALYEMLLQALER